MKVLIATSTFPLSPGDGTPRFVYDLAKALAGRCEVTVLAPHSPEAPRRESMGALDIRRFQYSWPEQTQCLAYGYGMRQNMKIRRAARAQVPGYVASLALTVRRLVHAERFDVVNSHWVVPQGLGVSLALGRSSSTAHVVSAHAGDLFFLQQSYVGKHVARFVARRTEKFIPVGVHVRNTLNELLGDKTDWPVQPMGVDFERFSAAPVNLPEALPFKGNYVLFVGRLVEIKGVAYLLAAMRRLASRGLDCGLVVVGSGALKESLQAQAGALGIKDRVLFAGRLGHEEILPLLHGCEVLAIPSLVYPNGETEGVPTVLAEALSAGCKVVASRAGGIPDILVDGHNGWLARPNDAEDLSRKLIEAVCHSDERIGRRARETAREMDWPRVADNYMACFEDALRLKRGR